MELGVQRGQSGPSIALSRSILGRSVCRTPGRPAVWMAPLLSTGRPELRRPERACGEGSVRFQCWRLFRVSPAGHAAESPVERSPQRASRACSYQSRIRASPLAGSFALQRWVGDSVTMISSVGRTRPSCRCPASAVPSRLSRTALAWTVGLPSRPTAMSPTKEATSVCSSTGDGVEERHRGRAERADCCQLGTAQALSRRKLLQAAHGPVTCLENDCECPLPAFPHE